MLVMIPAGIKPVGFLYKDTKLKENILEGRK